MDQTFFIMSLTDSSGHPCVSFSSDGGAWSDPGKGLFNGWETDYSPRVVEYACRAYMCITDKDNHVYLVEYDPEHGSWGDPNAPGARLFNGLTTRGAHPPSLIATDTLSMVLVRDSDHGIYWSQLNPGGWSDPVRLFGDWETRFTPTLACARGTLYMALTDGNGRVYVSTYTSSGNSSNPSQWSTPVYNQNYLFGDDWHTNQGEAPTLYAQGDALHMCLLRDNNHVYRSWFDPKDPGAGWSTPDPLFGDWACDWTPTVAVHDGVPYLCICDKSGHAYMSQYDLGSGSWSTPVEGVNILFGSSWECYYNRTPFLFNSAALKPFPFVSKQNWMKGIPDGTSIAQITIPGTHDSCARHGGDWPTCQTLSILDQLNLGIRFLDLRCCRAAGQFLQYHGPTYQELEFGSGVRDVCTQFLKDNPSEFIILSISDSSADTGLDPEPFEVILQRYIDTTIPGDVEVSRNKWYVKNAFPTIDEVRGKMVVMRRYPAKMGSTIGINATYDAGWRNKGFDQFTLLIGNGNQAIVGQDWDDVATLFDIHDKWDRVEKQLIAARSGVDKDHFYVNFASGSSSGCYPRYVAKGTISEQGVNSRLLKYLADNPKGPYGLIALDFLEYPSSELTLAIIQSNFQKS